MRGGGADVTAPRGDDALRAQLSVARNALSEQIRKLAAERRKLAQLQEDIARMHDSPGYRLAKALHESRKSFRGLVHLPLRLAAIAWTVITGKRRMPEAASIASVEAEQARIAPPDAGNDPRRLRFAVIADEFTALALAPEVALCQLSPAHWREEIERFDPHALFVESAWRGNMGLWRDKIVPLSAEMVELLDWCTQHNVPTVFWNKEDPIHFDHFLATAVHFDHICTTDADCAPRYASLTGRRATALPFAAQPAIHHPLENEARIDAFCFAGSYYRKYGERQRDFMRIVDRVQPHRPVAIFDRNQGRNDPEFEFPEELQPYIVGSAAPAEIDAVYKRYRFAINVNTVKRSGTMCARRVFDLLACNTPLVSNECAAYPALFGPETILVVSEQGESPGLRRVLEDPSAYRRHRLAGLRVVMERHTWQKRIAALAEQLGLPPHAGDSPTLVAVARIADAGMLDKLLHVLAGQTRTADAVLVLAASGLERDAPGCRFFDDANALARELGAIPEAWMAYLDMQHHYGADYLRDLATATTYAKADAIGKGAHFVSDGAGGIELRNDGEQYRRDVALRPSRAILRAARWPERIGEMLAGREGAMRGVGVDEYNFCEFGAPADPDALRRVDA